MTQYPVRGYYHPESCFATIAEWEDIANQFLKLQKQGADTRGGVIDNNPKLVELINRWFSFQLYVETQRYDLLTQKNVLDFIEDFVNHKVWGLRREFATYFYNDAKDDSYVNDIKIAYFYSRGDIEPYVLLCDKFTQYTYGTTDHIVTTLHWTSLQGMKNLVDSIENKMQFDISTFTKEWKPFFQPESNYLVKVQGKLVAAFKSDVKSIATDGGNKAANMYRLAFPGEASNLCHDVNLCSDDDDSTSLWNEIIVQPTKILSYKKVNKY